MKILYICHEPLPSPHTNTEQLLQTAAALVEQSCKVDLIFPKKIARYETKAESQEMIASFYGLDPDVFEKGLRLIERPGLPWFPGIIQKPIHDLRSVLYGRENMYDLVYCRDTFTLLASLAAGVPAVFETYRYDINESTRYFPWRSYCYSRPQLLGFITHSQLAYQSFLDVGITPDKLLLAYNGCVPFPPTSAYGQEEIRRKLGLPADRKILLYTGHVNRKKGIEIFLPLAKKLNDYLFVLVGGLPGSVEFKRLEREIDARKISNITSVPRVPPSEVAGYLFAADCLIIPPTAEPLTKARRTVLPIKTFRYLAAGRPVVAPDLPDIREVLEHKRNAVLVPPDSPDETAQWIQKLFSDDSLRKRISENARNDALKYSWVTRAERIFTFLGEVLNGKEYKKNT